jgi:hypothetical protein
MCVLIVYFYQLHAFMVSSSVSNICFTPDVIIVALVARWNLFCEIGLNDVKEWSFLRDTPCPGVVEHDSDFIL